MKSLQELNAIRERMQNQSKDRKVADAQSIRIVVGMATCGIAAGARPVMNAFVEEVANENLTDKVTVTQSGCIGLCQYEPVCEVIEAGKEKVTYVEMTAEKVKRVMDEHIKGGKPVSEYTVGNK